jgi:hypothetical protein
MSTIIDIAQAVVTSLNAGEFGQEFQAERKYQPVFELSEMQTLHVTVVPKSVSISMASRNDGYFDCAIDVGVQKRVNVEDPDEIDALMDLVEQLADHLRQRRLDEQPEAVWLSIANEPVFAPEHLDQERTFTSVLTVTYRLRR